METGSRARAHSLVHPPQLVSAAVAQRRHVVQNAGARRKKQASWPRPLSPSSSPLAADSLSRCCGASTVWADRGMLFSRARFIIVPPCDATLEEARTTLSPFLATTATPGHFMPVRIHLLFSPSLAFLSDHMRARERAGRTRLVYVSDFSLLFFTFFLSPLQQVEPGRREGADYDRTFERRTRKKKNRAARRRVTKGARERERCAKSEATTEKDLTRLVHPSSHSFLPLKKTESSGLGTTCTTRFYVVSPTRYYVNTHMQQLWLGEKGSYSKYAVLVA